MINIFKSENHKMIEGLISDKETWISLIAPTKTELEEVASKTGALLEFLEAPLDIEERPRLEIEDKQTLIIISVPIKQKDVIESKAGQNQVIYDTIPLGIIITENNVITVCLQDVRSLHTLLKKHVSPSKKSRFTIHLFYQMAVDYLSFLRQIDRKTVEVEMALHSSLKNEQLIRLLVLQKSLVYFTTSLRSNEIVMNKLLRMNVLTKFEEDEDLLEDAIIELKQAIDMSDINANILAGMMDAFASIISNNLNILMKILASITIVLTIPTMVFSFFGMNVAIPGGDVPAAWVIILVLTAAAAIITLLIMRKKNFF